MDRLGIEKILGRLEPDTLPSQRLHRVVHVGSADVFEMRDANDGLGYPGSKTRYQYLRGAGGGVWTRMLPGEDFGDYWQGQTSPPAWRLRESAAESLLAEVLPLFVGDVGGGAAALADGDRVRAGISGERDARDSWGGG